jgi:hypothetical protein
VDANWRDTLAHMDPRVLPEMEALERELPPPQWARVAALLVYVDDAAARRLVTECDAETDAILAHFPGLQLAWEVVREHVKEESHPSCTAYRGLQPYCTLYAQPPA